MYCNISVLDFGLYLRQKWSEVAMTLDASLIQVTSFDAFGAINGSTPASRVRSSSITLSQTALPYRLPLNFHVVVGGNRFFALTFNVSLGAWWVASKALPAVPTSPTARGAVVNSWQIYSITPTTLCGNVTAPVFVGVVLNAFTHLAAYAILAQTGITTVDATTVTNGKVGNAGLPAQITGNFVTAGSPSGVDNSPAEIALANGELTALVGAINTYTATLLLTIVAGGSSVTITYLPNINYNSGSSLVYSTSTIIFDAGGNASAQFFLTASSAITFTTSTIELLNGACAGNIFWLAGTSITFTTQTGAIPGNLIAGTDITFTSTPAIIGRIYSRGTHVSFSGITSVTAVPQCYPSDPIVCNVSSVEAYRVNSFNPPLNAQYFPSMLLSGGGSALPPTPTTTPTSIGWFIPAQAP